MIVLTFDEYAALNGAAPDWGDAGTHKTSRNVSGIAKKRTLKRLEERNSELQTMRDALWLEYQNKIESGEIRQPTRNETLIKKAQGHPDRNDTQSARRLLEKIGVTY